MYNKLKFPVCFFPIFVLFLLQINSGCSPESTNPIAKNYHNTTARYNAYFIAKEKMKEVEGIVWKNNVDDFNNILNVFPVLKVQDTAQVSAAANDCMKKASIAIQRHKNSRWTDKCFNLIGESRVYLKDYKNAIETFKYVNTKGKDKNAKHEALISLMKLFVETGEYENAVSVGSYLRKENLNKVNGKDLNLVKADYFAKHNDYHKTESYLGFAIPDVDNLGERSRLYFIIGQIRQMHNDNSGALASYKKALKNNPTYEIAFYSRLNLAQVSEVSDKNDVKRVKKNFTKLLKDIRNEDFKDKIYYEMAKFELKQDHLEAGIGYLNKSVQASTINPKQKALSYLKLAEINYETLKKYEISKAYYDSTIALLPASEPDYQKISQRQKSLTNFVTQIKTIEIEDSLQRMGKMDTASLSKYLTQVETAQKAQAEKIAEKTSNEAFSSVFDELDPDNGNARKTDDNTAGWYFYSSIARSKGRSEFVKNWGNRPLEDNWRRAIKENAIAQSNADPQDSTATSQNQASASSSVFDKKALMAKIPKTSEDFKQSDKRIQDAYFVLGKIYDQELSEFPNAIETFEKLIAKYPKTEYKAEVYYYLYLLNKKVNGSKVDDYKRMLASEFPNSLYSKLLNNPNYLSDSKKEEQLLSNLYHQVYTLYEKDNIELASKKIDSLMRIYPENSLADKFVIVKALISGKTESIDVYRKNLNQFIEMYPESTLIPYAQNLLQTTQTLERNKKEMNELGGVYKPNLNNRPHYFFVAYPSRSTISEEDEQMINDVKNFNLANNSELNLEVTPIALGQSKIILVKQFPGKYEALEYYARFKEESSPLNKYKELNLNVFVISDENFQTFNQNKDINEYLSFFEKTY